MTPGARYRMVTTQGLSRHVSSVVMSEEEALEHLDMEAYMHQAAGWDVSLSGSMLVAHKLGESGVLTRTIAIEKFSPMGDSP